MSAAQQTVLSRDLAVRMMPALHRIAYELARRLPRHVRIDDLVGAGREGLVSAIARFDPAHGEGFEAYAECRMRGAMLDELRACDPLSRAQRAHANHIAASTRALIARLGRAPAADEIARELGVSLDTYWEWLAAGATGVAFSFDADSFDAEDDSAVQFHDPRVEPADESLARKQRKDAVNRALEALPARSRQILVLHYAEGLTLREIGELLGLCESRVCQIQIESVGRLRELCGAHITGAPAPSRPAARASRRAACGTGSLSASRRAPRRTVFPPAPREKMAISLAGPGDRAARGRSSGWIRDRVGSIPPVAPDSSCRRAG